jgi:hypothetical protein
MKLPWIYLPVGRRHFWRNPPEHPLRPCKLGIGLTGGRMTFSTYQQVRRWVNAYQLTLFCYTELMAGDFYQWENKINYA